MTHVKHLSNLSNWINLFPSISGNLALCVAITILRVAEWRKINANIIISVSGLSLAQE
jgi:hypothetical protein